MSRSKASSAPHPPESETYQQRFRSSFCGAEPTTSSSTSTSPLPKRLPACLDCGKTVCMIPLYTASAKSEESITFADTLPFPRMKTQHLTSSSSTTPPWANFPPDTTHPTPTRSPFAPTLTPWAPSSGTSPMTRLGRHPSRPRTSIWSRCSTTLSTTASRRRTAFSRSARTAVDWLVRTEKLDQGYWRFVSRGSGGGCGWICINELTPPSSFSVGGCLGQVC